MEIRGQCPACQAKYKVAPKYAGKTLRCPKCQAAIEVPQPQAESSTSATPPPPAPPPPTAATPCIQPTSDPLSEFRIDTSDHKRRSGTPSTPDRKPRGRRKTQWPLVLGLSGICAVLAIVTVAVVVYSSRPDVPQKARTVAKAATPRPALQSSPSPRPAAPKPTAIEAPKAHEIPSAATVPTASIRGFEGWQQILATARHQAAAENKDIVIVFGCSDSQPATQHLATALKDPAAEQVTKDMVRVVIDFPRSREAHELLQDATQHRHLWDTFALDRLPALALADSEGRTYWLTQHWDDGFDKLATQIQEWQQRKRQRDELFAATKADDAEQQLAAAAKAISWLQEHDLWRFYRAEIDQWAILA